MQVLRLLAARRQRRAVSSTITAARSEVPDSSEAEAEAEEDEGPFFDLDFSSSSSVRASSSSGSESDDACSDLDFIISLHRSRSASPSYYHETTTLLLPPQPPHDLCASDPSNKKAPTSGSFYGGRPSFASSARSLRLFMESPADEAEDVVDASERNKRGAAPSGDVIRRYLTKISRRLRSVRSDTTRGIGIHRRLRKSRSASAAVALAPSRRDDSLIEKQDGIASAIAHCKESFQRASLSDCDSSLLRSRSDPGRREASSSQLK